MEEGMIQAQALEMERHLRSLLYMGRLAQTAVSER
jgi:hypothetical protein